MDIHTVSHECVALVVHNAGQLDPAHAAELVRGALADGGESVWEKMTIDLFSRGDDALIIAQPTKSGAVAVADYALPFLISHFGD